MERALFILWGIWLLLIFIAAFRVFAYLIARRAEDKRWATVKQDFSLQKKATVIVPVKGFDLQSTPPFFDTLFYQNYSEYRIIVAFESWEDPVAEWLCEELEVSESAPVWTHPSAEFPLRQVILACGGPAEEEGQKVCNQLAAFQYIEEEDEIIVFADADISLDKNWLASLTAPINFESHKLSTTYRWLVPKRPNLASQLASVINGSITTQGGWQISNVLWGGSMAIHREVFLSLNVPELVKGSLNDDLRISKAARKAGNKIAFVRSLVLPTMIDFDTKAFLEFAKRQYTQVKFFSPILYLSTNLLLGFYALGFLSILMALVYGIFYAWIPLAAAYVIDQFRGLARQQVYLSLFPENGIRKKLSATCWLEQMLTPFWMLIHWMIVVSTWTQSRIQWGGIHYKIYSNSKTKILERSSSHDPLPVGVPGLSMIAALHDLPRAASTAPISPARTTGVPATEPISPVVEPVSPITEPISPAEPATAESEAETSVPITAVPTEPAPKLSHPGISIHVTPLSETAISFLKARPVRTKSSSILFRHGKPVHGISAHTRIVSSTRYPVPSPVSAIASSPVEKETTAGSLPRVSRNLSIADTYLARQTGAGARLSGIVRDEKSESGSAIHGMSSLALTLSKTADIPRVHFPTRPSLATSSRPSGVRSAVAGPVQETPPPAPPQRQESGSRARVTDNASVMVGPIRKGSSAHRPIRKGLVKNHSLSGIRVAKSGRANLASSKRRGLGRNRPVSRGASGRSI